MPAKVIPGTSRTTLRFMLVNWKGLLIVSVLPLGLLICVMGLAIYTSLGTLQLLTTLDRTSPQFPAEFMHQYVQMLPFTLLFGLLLAFTFAWLYVRVTRFWKTGRAILLVDSRDEFLSAGYTLAYALGIGLLTSVAYMVVVIAALLVALVIIGLAHLLPIFKLLLVPLFAAVYFSLIWFSTRLHIAMPQVALGETPNLLPDIWNLSKGESLAVPLRLLLAMLVISVPFFAAGIAFLIPQMETIQQAAQNSASQKLVFDALMESWRTMLPFNIFGIGLMLLMTAYFTVFFAEANERLRNKKIQAER